MHGLPNGRREQSQPNAQLCLASTEGCYIGLEGGLSGLWFGCKDWQILSTVEGCAGLASLHSGSTLLPRGNSFWISRSCHTCASKEDCWTCSWKEPSLQFPVLCPTRSWKLRKALSWPKSQGGRGWSPIAFKLPSYPSYSFWHRGISKALRWICTAKALNDWASLPFKDSAPLLIIWILKCW